MSVCLRGQDTTLQCHSEAFPKSINYWIMEEGQMLISSKKTYREIKACEMGNSSIMRYYFHCSRAAGFCEEQSTKSIIVD